MLNRLKIEYYYRLFNFKRKYFRLVDVRVDGIDGRDAPDFCDAYIACADWHIPILNLCVEANETDLEYLNEDSSLVYDYVIDHLY